MDRGAVASSMRRAAKEDGGPPKEAFVRAATDDELDRACEDTGGARPRGDGGVYLEPPGGKNVRTVPDQRALENMRARAAKRQGQKPTAASAPVNSAASAPVPVHEDWEAAGPASGAPARPHALVARAGWDHVERARMGALCALGDLPPGIELYVGPNAGREAFDLIMGFGLLIGQGYAALREGGGWYVTEKGRLLYRSEGFGE
jgi:hypothetical protein